MKKFQVITDSTADIVKEECDSYEIDYLQMVFTIEDKTYNADLDWKDISAKDYYQLMRNGKRAITGLIQTIEVEEKFEKYLKEGKDVLYIACSSKLSGSLNSAKIIASELADRYPDNKIVCFDSLRSNYAEGMMAIDAAKMANAGKTIDEAVDELTQTRLKYQVYATVGSLDWLKKAGRVKASAAFFGNLLGVKPIILSDAIGNNYAFKKVKGRKTSLDEMINIVSERIENPTEANLYIEHADCLSDAEYIANALKNNLKVKNILIHDLGPIIGATTGPDTITVSFFGEKVIIAGEE